MTWLYQLQDEMDALMSRLHSERLMTKYFQIKTGFHDSWNGGLGSVHCTTWLAVELGFV